MQVYGYLEKAQIENASADLTSTLPGLIWFNTTDNKVRFYDNGAIRSVVDEDTVQDVANKTFESGAISNFLDFTHNTTPANPAAGSIRVYPKADNKLYKLDSDGFEEEIGTGGGQAGINYIENWNAEKDLDGVSINGTIPLALETADPLFGEKSFKVTGDGVTDFSGDIIEIDMLTVDGAVPYTMVSGEFWVRNQELSSGDMIVKIYDIDNAQYISLSEGEEIGASLLPSFTHSFAFQATDSLNYRVDVEIVDGSSAFEFVWDNIIVGPAKPAVIGSAGWKSYDLTVTGTNWTTVKAVGTPYKTLDGSWRMAFNVVGTVPSLLRGSFIATVTGVDFYAGQSIVASPNASVASTNIARTYVNGQLEIYHNNGTTTGYIYSGDVLLNSKPDFATDYSNVVLSETTMNREISLSAYLGSSQVITSTGATTVVFSATDVDTTNSYNTTNGKYIIPEDGNYYVDSTLFLDGVVNPEIMVMRINVNGAVLASNTNTNFKNVYGSIQLSKLLPLKKDDEVEIVIKSSSDTNYTVYSGKSYSNLSLTKVNTGSQTIAASETIVARCSTTAGQTIPITAYTIVGFDTIEIDTHNAVSGSGSSWRFTAPTDGIYEVSGMVTWANYPANSKTESLLTMGGVYGQYLIEYSNSVGNIQEPIKFMGMRSLTKGQTISFSIYQPYTSGGESLATTTGTNFIQIKRI